MSSGIKRPEYDTISFNQFIGKIFECLIMVEYYTSKGKNGGCLSAAIEKQLSEMQEII